MPNHSFSLFFSGTSHAFKTRKESIFPLNFVEDLYLFLFLHHISLGLFYHLTKFTSLVQFNHNVTPTYELTAHVQLRNCWLLVRKKEGEGRKGKQNKTKQNTS